MVTDTGHPADRGRGRTHLSRLLLVALHVCLLLVVVPHVGPAAADGPPQSVVEAPTPLGDIEEIESGYAHRCVLRGDGSVWCWGQGFFGALGTGSYRSSITPTQVELPASAVDVAAGYVHTCAVLTTGDVWCWGANDALQLGAAGPRTAVPTKVPGVSSVAAIWAGDRGNCVRRTNDAVLCWGYNGNGNLVLPESTAILPTTMTGIAGVADMALTIHATCALLADDSVRCWGEDEDGALGDGPGNNGPFGSADAVEPIGTTNVRSLDGGERHVCVVRNGQLATSTRCWGDNFMDQSVPTQDATFLATPTLIPGLTRASDVDINGDTTCVRTVTGDAVCWGRTLGFTGEELPTRSDVTVVVDGGVAAVSLSGLGVCTLSAGGQAFCQGYNVVGTQAGVPGGRLASGTVMQYDPAFTPVDRVRLKDTHPSGATIDGLDQQSGRIPANRNVRVRVNGRTGVPAGGASVIVRVRVDGAPRAGQLSVFRCATPGSRGTAVSFGRTHPTAATTAVALKKGRLCLRANRSVHVVVDLLGRQATDDDLRAVTPTRVWDTRPQGATIDGQFQRTGLTEKGVLRAIPVVGRGSVPSSAVSAVMLSVTAGNGRAAGSYVVSGCEPQSSRVVSGQYSRKGLATTFVVAPVSALGQICVRTSSRTHVTVDVVAVLGGGGAFQSSDPVRLVDTRPTGITDWGGSQATGLVNVNEQNYIPLDLIGNESDISMVATPSRAVVLTITATGATQRGRIDVSPCSGTPGGGETLYVRPGAGTSGTVVIEPSPEGFVCFTSTAPTHVMVDLVGRFHR